jgi:hypothetical protein
LSHHADSGSDETEIGLKRYEEKERGAVYEKILIILQAIGGREWCAGC